MKLCFVCTFNAAYCWPRCDKLLVCCWQCRHSWRSWRVKYELNLAGTTLAVTLQGLLKLYFHVYFTSGIWRAMSFSVLLLFHWHLVWKVISQLFRKFIFWRLGLTNSDLVKIVWWAKKTVLIGWLIDMWWVCQVVTSFDSSRISTAVNEDLNLKAIAESAQK